MATTSSRSPAPPITMVRHLRLLSGAYRRFIVETGRSCHLDAYRHQHATTNQPRAQRLSHRLPSPQRDRNHHKHGHRQPNTATPPQPNGDSTPTFPATRLNLFRLRSSDSQYGELLRWRTRATRPEFIVTLSGSSGVALPRRIYLPAPFRDSDESTVGALHLPQGLSARTSFPTAW